MNMQKSQEKIEELMALFLFRVKSANAMGKTDINRIAETVLIPLFSEIYGHEDLRNLNTSENPNFPAIDLGDKKTRTAYQITSDPSSQKIKETLTKFVEHGLHNEYNHLIVYILTEKQQSYRAKFDDIIKGKFSFNAKNDIRDFKDLLKEISSFSIEKLQKIEELLEQQFGEEKDDPQDIVDWIESVNNYWRGEESSSKIKIDREIVRNDLYDFASQDNGIVIGSPGVGKTYLLKELLRHLKSEDIPHLLLPIDLLGDSNPKEWPDGFSFQGNLIDALKSVPISEKKGIIVFDGFDAARDDKKRKNFLILIQQAIQELDNWNVIVTVRTYDAKKSKELLALFKGPNESDQTKYQIEKILCRHFSIAPFSQDEILHALNQIGYPETIYLEGSDEFKSILSNPFNIWVLENILKFSSHEDIRTLSKIRSEVQLLDRFWEQRIENENSERVLRRISSKMVENRSLIVKIDDIYDNVDLDNPERRIAWDKLQSDEILSKTSSTRQQLAFSHNILFDYAISVLHIEDDPKELEAFLEIDQARALFLRPSLTYFFTRLWYYKPDSFWQAFWHILPKDQSVHLRLVARLIPPSVIANEARKVKELKPLFEKLSNPDDLINNAIMWLLQSLRTLQSEHDSLWIDFFDRVSEHLNVNFAMDLATLTSGILDRAIETDKSDIINTCGRIGRRLLEWVWQEKETKADDWYNRLGGYWAVPLVSKTFHTNVEESRVLLEKVLKLMNEDNFPIGFLSRLSEHIDKIWDHDPEFAILIYRTVFSHQFTSEGETQRGTPILSITTYRSQDFSMCQYRLVKHFHQFLQENPKPATQAAIQSLNCFIAKEHVFQFSRKDMTIEELNEPFDIHGKTANFVQDHSYIWDARSSSDEPIEMVDSLFEYIAELAEDKEKHPLLDSLLDVFIDHVVFAFFWKRLLKTASKFPKVFAPRLFELCIAKPILLYLEVSYELGLFLENAASEFLSDNKLRQIEESILALPTEVKDQENDDYLIMHRNSLLARIPKELLSTEKAKLIREEMEHENNVPENRPPVSFNIWSESYTEEKWLRDKGVDTTTPENEKLQEFSQILEQFCKDWKKDGPTSEAAKLVLPQLQMVYTTVTKNTAADNEIVNILWRKLVECAAILAGISDSLDSDSFTFCRQVILEGAKHELPLPDPQYDAQYDSTGYSPFPRHEAAKGLSLLAYHKPDTEILDAIEKLADDPVPSVRMLTAMQLTNVYAKNPDRYWKIIYKRSEFERNLVVQECLYRTLKRLVAHNKENENKTTTVMAKLLNHTPCPELKIGTSDPFINLLMWLVIERENSWAIDFIKDTYSDDPIQHSSLLTRIVRRTMENYVISEQLESDGDREIVKRAINCVSEVITVSSKKIKELCLSINENTTEEKQQKLQNTYRVIDQVISSLYYSFAHEKGKSENQTEIISKEIRCHFYEEVKPLMQQVIDFADDSETGIMFASTAHDFIQVLTSFLICNPKEVIHFVELVAKSSERFGYNLDSIAVKDIVDFVEIVLADYRHEVRDDEESLEHLLNLLDLFAKTGWSDALNLVWRLDEVFR